MKPSRGQFLPWTDGALFLGTPSEIGFHSHHALELIVGLDAPLVCKPAPPSSTEDLRAVAIGPSLTHRVASDGEILALLLEPERAPYRRWAEAYGVVPEPAIRQVHPVGELLGAARAFRESPRSGSAKALLERLLGFEPSFGGEPYAPMDSRVRRALELVRRDPGRHRNVTSLARSVGLSITRFSQLFVEATGIPARRFLRWAHTRAAVEAVLQGASLTEAAQASGFFDSSHLARGFREMLGFPGSSVRAGPDGLHVAPLPVEDAQKDGQSLSRRSVQVGGPFRAYVPA